THEGLGLSELATPYRSRSAFASSVRPSASSASAVTRALSLVPDWSRPQTLSWFGRAVLPRGSAPHRRPLRRQRGGRLQRTRLVVGTSGPTTFSTIASARWYSGLAPPRSPCC